MSQTHFFSQFNDFLQCILVHWASRQADPSHKSSHPAPRAQIEDPALVGVVLTPDFCGHASLLEPPEQPVVCWMLDDLI